MKTIYPKLLTNLIKNRVPKTLIMVFNHNLYLAKTLFKVEHSLFRQCLEINLNLDLGMSGEKRKGRMIKIF